MALQQSRSPSKTCCCVLQRPWIYLLVRVTLTSCNEADIYADMEHLLGSVTWRAWPVRPLP